MEVFTLPAESPRESTWPLPYLKKISVKQLLGSSRPDSRRLCLAGAQEDSPTLERLYENQRVGPKNDQTSMNCRPGNSGPSRGGERSKRRFLWRT